MDHTAAKTLEECLHAVRKSQPQVPARATLQRPGPTLSQAQHLLSSRPLMFNLGSIFYAALLLINAMAVLSEERFLAPSSYLIVVQCSTSLTSKVSRMVILSNAERERRISTAIRPRRSQYRPRNESAINQSHWRRADSDARYFS